MKYPVEIDENLYEKRINVAFVTPAGEELDFDPNNPDDVEDYIPLNDRQEPSVLPTNLDLLNLILINNNVLFSMFLLSLLMLIKLFFFKLTVDILPFF